MRDLTDLYTWTRSRGRSRDLLTSDAVGHEVGRSGAPLRRAGVDRQRRLPALHRRQPRAGILQRAALLASSLEQTNPFHRGAFVRRSILCDPLPQPDPNSLPPGSLDPPPVTDSETTRQRFAAKVDGNGLCQACHGQFSNLGYILEAYDALGRFRTRRRCSTSRPARCWPTLPIDTTARAAGRVGRHRRSAARPS